MHMFKRDFREGWGMHFCEAVSGIENICDDETKANEEGDNDDSKVKMAILTALYLPGSVRAIIKRNRTGQRLAVLWGRWRSAGSGRGSK